MVDTLHTYIRRELLCPSCGGTGEGASGRDCRLCEGRNRPYAMRLCDRLADLVVAARRVRDATTAVHRAYSCVCASDETRQKALVSEELCAAQKAYDVALDAIKEPDA